MEQADIWFFISRFRDTQRGSGWGFFVPCWKKELFIFSYTMYNTEIVCNQLKEN